MERNYNVTLDKVINKDGDITEKGYNKHREMLLASWNSVTGTQAVESPSLSSGSAHASMISAAGTPGDESVS